MPLDINLSPIYRIQGRDQANMPGMLALDPPRNAARGREQDRLIVYLALTGNAAITTGEYRKFAEDAAAAYYQTPRAVTSALRAAADSLNKVLLERNMQTSAQGQYTLAWMALAALRESQCIFSVNGPIHAYWFGANGSRHFFDPSISGKGLGSSQTIAIHYAQSDLNPGDLMLFCGRVPDAWVAPLEDAKPSSFDAMRRRLTTLTTEDLNAVLFQTVAGTGAVNVYNGTNEPKADTPATEKAMEEEPAPLPAPDLPAFQGPEPTPEAHVLQPSAYAIPPQREEARPYAAPAVDPLANLPHKTAPRDFPASIPRAKPKAEATPPGPENGPGTTEAPQTMDAPFADEQAANIPAPAPSEPSIRAKQTAKAIVGFMQGFRQASTVFGERFRNFLPRLLPATESPEAASVSPTAFMGFMAVLIPLIVVTIAVVVYLRYGRNEQYDVYYNQALEMKQQALALTSPVEQRIAWENVLANLDRAEEHRETSETITLRQEAQQNRDLLLGITRLQFNPAFSAKPGIDVSRMAATENDLYLLNAANGEALRAIPSGGGGFELDPAFNCRPDANNNAGPLVDILVLPITNIYGATLLGIDARGNLLYCKSGDTPRSGVLTAPDTNWERVTAFILDGGNLYVLDATARAVWVYTGKEAAFTDRPYFFFGEQTPTQDVIDFVVSGDEMHLLHSDGRVSTCFFSRIDTSGSKCDAPLPYQNPFPAATGLDVFGAAHFTQILFAAPPDPSLLLLDAEGPGVMRFAPRSLELQNQFHPTTGGANPIPQAAAGAVAVSPNHVLYVAVDGQVYFAVDMP